MSVCEQSMWFVRVLVHTLAIYWKYKICLQCILYITDLQSCHIALTPLLRVKSMGQIIIDYHSDSNLTFAKAHLSFLPNLS
jgi:hypothetical protein